MAGTAVGAARAAAGRLGVTFDEYRRRQAAGERWCTGCKDWHAVTEFPPNTGSCRSFRNERKRSTYTPRPRKRYGPLPKPARDGDRKQARQRINVEVRTGRRPRPNTLPCVDCGHVWAEGERRHEYDHHLGYAPEHHLTVEPVCTTCHARRARERGEIRQTRGARGRYATTGGDVGRGI